MNQITKAKRSGIKQKWRNITEHEQFIILRNALNSNDSNQIKQRVKEGIDINVTDEFGNSNILMYYIQNRRRLQYDPSRIIHLFIKLGINIDHQRHGKLNASSALHFAVANRFLDIIEILLDSNAEIDIKDIGGNTPLITAALNSEKDERYSNIIHLLIEKGADTTIENYKGENAQKILSPSTAQTG